MMNAKKEKRNAKKKKRKEKKGGSDHGNLEPGREYTMTGRLMYKDTGKAVSVYGKEVTASQTFTPKEKDGSVKLTFTVAVHADLSDKNQTVEYPKDKTPDKPSDDKPSGDNARRTVTSSPKTGDDTNLALWIGILLVSAAGAAITVILMIRKRRKKKTW